MWDDLVTWFTNKRDKYALVKDFNRKASNAWDCGDAPTLLRAKVTWGDSKNKHNFSDIRSGFRIKAATSGNLEREQCIVIGMIIISDQVLTRKLIRLGFDTLEIYGSNPYDLIEYSLTELLLPE